MPYSEGAGKYHVKGVNYIGEHVNYKKRLLKKLTPDFLCA